MFEGNPKLRVARPSDDLEALIPFYRDGLGLAILSRFNDHDGFDGLIFGSPDAPYHFEFVHARGHLVGRAPTEDHLLVLYEPNTADWARRVARLEDAGFPAAASFNPYWDLRGRTFEDPDGYRIVLQNAAWNL